LDRRTTGIAIIVIGIIGLLAYPLYAGFAWYNFTAKGSGPPWNPGMMGPWSGQGQTVPPAPVTLDEAKATAQQYLVSLNNPGLAIKEVMEFQYNFYIIYYEKDTGRGAFEMLIWKQAPPEGMMSGGMGMGGMMGGYGAVGVITPEPGPNMMWNSKYSPMNNGMMRGSNQASSAATVSSDKAAQLAQQYLDTNFNGAKVEMGTQFYGYYTFDFTVNDKIVGMVSVNADSGQVWYHSWHGAFIQEVEYD
jgi:hypothetical protein